MAELCMRIGDEFFCIIHHSLNCAIGSVGRCMININSFELYIKRRLVSSIESDNVFSNFFNFFNFYRVWVVSRRAYDCILLWNNLINIYHGLSGDGKLFTKNSLFHLSLEYIELRNKIFCINNTIFFDQLNICRWARICTLHNCLKYIIITIAKYYDYTDK